MRVGAESSNRRGFTLIEVIGALVIFSAGVLVLLNLIGVLSLQLNRAGKSTSVAVAVQNRLDSLERVPYDSLIPGSFGDTIDLRGEPFLRRHLIVQATPLVREVQVTVEPVDGRGPELTASAFVSRLW
ncbi:MAG: prepilin-type N-terminal cleavage/methylation domain-containing protein [Gemmatimonadota bacterium]